MWHRFRSSLCVAAASIVTGIAALPARADETDITGSVRNSTGQTGANFAAHLTYNPLTPTTGALIVDITNTSPASVGGFLTGVVFRIDSTDPSAGATLVSTTDADFLDTGEESASPFGNFDAGAALNANWTGGGNPSAGLAPGGSAVLTFVVSASDAGTLSVNDFAMGTDFPSIVVRFRGLNTGGSDKVPVSGVPCDWNGDGVINSDDFFDFLDDFFDDNSDYDGNGLTNIKDFFDFLRCYFTHGG